MKKLFQILFLTTLITGFLCGGCTGPSRTAYTTIAVVQAGVEASMATWNTYVKAERIKRAADPGAMEALRAKESKVRDGLQAYSKLAQASIDIARASGGNEKTTLASPDMSASAAGLRQLVTSLAK